MTSDTVQDLEGLKAIGKVVGHTIAEMKKVTPGMTTAGWILLELKFWKASERPQPRR